MKEKLKSYLEPNQKIRTVETIALVMLLLGSLFSYVRGTAALHKDPGELAYIETTTLARDFDAEDYDEDSTSCDVIFANEEGQLIKTYTYEEYEELKDESIDAYVYETDEGIKLFFDHKDPNPDVIKGVYRQTMGKWFGPVFRSRISYSKDALAFPPSFLWSVNLSSSDVQVPLLIIVSPSSSSTRMYVPSAFNCK